MGTERKRFVLLVSLEVEIKLTAVTTDIGGATRRIKEKTTREIRRRTLSVRPRRHVFPNKLIT
jgi:hypothetical protein